MLSYFKRPHHNAILKALRSLDGKFLGDCDCYFAGGTAISLALDEYRESVDIDFLCGAKAGYRELRSLIWGGKIEKLLPSDNSGNVRQARDITSDMYGVRTILDVDGVKIKFEIVSDDRITLSGRMSDLYGVPVLCQDDLFAEKLLANADRYNDTSTMSRDIIDLTMMIHSWGQIPQVAWDKASSAYGDAISKSYDAAIDKIENREWLRKCFSSMKMDLKSEKIFEDIHEWPHAILRDTFDDYPEINP